MTVHELPRAPMTPERLAEIRDALTAPPLTPEDLLHGPIDAIRQPGPWCAGDDLLDPLVRVHAIVGALVGPGRVPLGVGLDAALSILATLRRQVQP